VTLWDVGTGAKQDTLEPGAEEAEVSAMAFMPGRGDGRTLAAGRKDGTITLYDLNGKKRVRSPLRGHTATIKSVDFCSDGRTLASGSEDGFVKLWDVKSASLQLTLREVCENTQGITRIRFSPDGRLLASRSQNGVVTLWRADAAAEPPAEVFSRPLIIGGVTLALIVVFAIWIFRKWTGAPGRGGPIQEQTTFRGEPQRSTGNDARA
jgi:WD40 repeat protein